jgi:hypothetical protein
MPTYVCDKRVYPLHGPAGTSREALPMKLLSKANEACVMASTPHIGKRLKSLHGQEPVSTNSLFKWIVVSAFSRGVSKTCLHC